jgi:hypothetical protein
MRNSWGQTVVSRENSMKKKNGKNKVDKNSKYRNNKDHGLHPGIADLVILLARISAEEDYDAMMQKDSED